MQLAGHPRALAGHRQLGPLSGGGGGLVCAHGLQSPQGVGGAQIAAPRDGQPQRHRAHQRHGQGAVEPLPRGESGHDQRQCQGGGECPCRASPARSAEQHQREEQFKGQQEDRHRVPAGHRQQQSQRDQGHRWPEPHVTQRHADHAGGGGEEGEPGAGLPPGSRSPGNHPHAGQRREDDEGGVGHGQHHIAARRCPPGCPHSSIEPEERRFAPVLKEERTGDLWPGRRPAALGSRVTRAQKH